MEASVVIPTFNRRESLRRTLESLSRQTFEFDRMEVVVVDDGSTDGTERVCQGSFSFRLFYLRQAHQGVVAARNLGASTAHGKILVFVDDDMTHDPGYLGALVEAHREYARCVSMGRIRVSAGDNPTRFARIYSELETGLETADSTVPFAACGTANLSVERQAYFEIGGMQTVAGDAWGAWGDVDFAYRAWKLGFQFRLIPRAVCTHHDHSIKTLKSASTRAEMLARLVHPLLERHPEIQSHLPMFLDKTPVDWRSESLKLTVRKLIRIPASSRTALRILEAAASVLEAAAPRPFLLLPVYRWTIGGYLYRGYRDGMKDPSPKN